MTIRYLLAAQQSHRSGRSDLTGRVTTVVLLSGHGQSNISQAVGSLLVYLGRDMAEIKELKLIGNDIAATFLQKSLRRTRNVRSGSILIEENMEIKVMVGIHYSSGLLPRPKPPHKLPLV